MEQIKHDLFTVLSRLAGHKDKASLKQQLVNDLNRIFEGHNWQWHETPPRESTFVAVASGGITHGYLFHTDELPTQDEETLRQAVPVVAAFLERLDYGGFASGQQAINGESRNGTVVSSHKGVESVVKENLGHLKALLDNLQMGVLVEDAHRQLLHVNRKFCQLFGISSPEELARVDLDEYARRVSYMFLEPEKFMSGIRRILSERRMVARQELSLKDGRTFARDYVPIFIEGRFYGNMWIYRDISERKKVERDLEYWLEFERLIIEISNNFIDLPVEDTDRGIHEALARIGRFAGVDRSYIFQIHPGGKYFDNTHEWCAPNITPQVEQLKNLAVEDYRWWMDKLHRKEPIFIRHLDDLPGEAEHLKKSLESQDIFALAVVPMIYRNRLVGFLGFDWVERQMHWSEEVINLLNIMGDVFTNALMQQKAEKELLEAKNRAEESDRLKSAFLANMSHEIRTPMNGIMGFAQLLNNSAVDERKRDQYIGIIYNSSRQLLRIVNDVLDISKIETGQYELYQEEFNLNDLLVELFTEFSQQEHQDVQLYVYKAFPNTNASVVTDRTKLRQILFNLLSNAFKYTRQGSIEFGYFSEGEGENLKFYVKDTGVGIPRDQQDVVFERFNRGESDENTHHGGTGLGLSICHGLVELLGGSMGVESEEGAGSVFYFTLPYQPGSSANGGAAKQPEREETEKRDLLVVEDDQVNAIFINELLKDLGVEETFFSIHHVYRGEEAVAFCRDNPGTELVLMDIKLPDIDGLEATRRIKEHNPRMPVIAQTAYAMESDRNKALEHGLDDYVSKPIDREQLGDILYRFLNISRQA